jgi:hypothetical protein
MSFEGYEAGSCLSGEGRCEKTKSARGAAAARERRAFATRAELRY